MLEFILGILCGAVVMGVTLAVHRSDELERDEAVFGRLYREVMEQPNCNDCADRECPYRPEWGAAVRINCPLHVTHDEGGE